MIQYFTVKGEFKINLHLISEVVLFESELLPLAALGVVWGRVFPVFLQLQAHLLQLVLVTQQLLFLKRAQWEGGKREDPPPKKFKQPISSKWPQIEYVEKPNCMRIFFVHRGRSRVLLLLQWPKSSSSHCETEMAWNQDWNQSKLEKSVRACVCVYLLESSRRGWQDGSTEFLHGADGSREGWSREQRRHQVYPKDPGHHLLFTPVVDQMTASKHIGDYDECRYT